MALNKTATSTYMVLNYNTSPIGITTQVKSYLIPAGNDFEPSVLPLTLDEIVYVNTTTSVFKIGLLFFDEDVQADMYDELRIKDWQNILSNKDIEDILLNPTTDGLERLLKIENYMYFERIAGVFLGLKNAGADISNKVVQIIELRQKEMKAGKRKTAIEIRPRDVAEARTSGNDDMRKQLEAQAEQIAALTALIQKMTANGDEPAVDTESGVERPAKPTARSGTKGTRGSKPKKEESATAE